MNRTRATQLVLVNWRGVFYERYLLDRNVTALEGANGAGKTTVLIAAYLVLLPDMSRLRFTSVGEHAGTAGDKGVWGRLGEPGRPSYSVLEVRLPNAERLLAGVHLEQRAEPSVEATPFLITDLPDGVQLQDVLLERGEADAVPELPQLRDQVARLGGRLHVFVTAKDYFGALFDRGVTPLRLANDEERTKLNEMLRTSMTGGISRALTSELAEFLLKEESGLADTLKRMRSNLEACRRTRTEVEESRRLEQEISAVYEAGQEMFSAAVHATRERACELEKRVETARDNLREAERSHEQLSSGVAEAKREHEKVAARVSEIRQSLDGNRELLRRLKSGQQILQRITEREESLQETERGLEEAQRGLAEAETHRASIRRAQEQAHEARELAAGGLADFQKGLEELSRRAGQHRLAVEHLEQAKLFLPEYDVTAESSTDLLGVVEQSRESVQSELVAIDQLLSTVEAKQREHQEVLAALRTLVDAEVPAATAFQLARAALAHLRELESEAAMVDWLLREVGATAKLADKQDQVRAKAAELETAGVALTSHEQVETALSKVEERLSEFEGQHRQEERAAELAEQAAVAAHEQIRSLEVAVGRWLELRLLARSLESAWARTLASPSDVAALRSQLVERRDIGREEVRQRIQKREALHEEATRLEQTGGKFPSELLKIRDLVDGDLLAGRFEEIPVEEAPRTQALLGPLAEAIVVDDPREASDAIVNARERPETVWLVGGEATLHVDEDGRPVGEVLDNNVLVPSSGGGWRLTRLPTAPTLGRRARENKIAQLREEEAAAAAAVDRARAELQRIEQALVSSETLLVNVDRLEHGDPSAELEAVQRIASEREKDASHHRAECKRLKELISLEAPLRTAFRELLPAAWVLDEPDQRGRLLAVQQRLQTARAAAAELASKTPARALLEEKLDVLRRPPPSVEESAALRVDYEAKQRRQEALTRGLLALRFLDANLAALEWTDAEEVLRREKALAPALQDQLERAKAAVAIAETKVQEAETAHQEAVNEKNEKYAIVQSLNEAIKRDREDWLQLGLDDASDSIIVATEVGIATLQAQLHELEDQSGQVSKRVARLELLLEQAAKKMDESRQALDEEERNWRPAHERWERLRTTAEEQGVLAATLTRRFVEAFSGVGSPNLNQKAREHATALKERLSRARDGEQVSARVSELLGPQDISGDVYLQAWLSVRNWLRRRIPAQIAEVDEPLEALGRLREHLAALQIRLARQEADLRGESEDVARNIDIHIRRAQRQVTRLTQELEKVRFGSIQGVRLRLDRVERMEQVLRALREGEDQGLLFQIDMPIEEALEELFKRYGGGRTGGQRLLDYREYIDPRLEVKRQAEVEWEAVNPNRLSTGEGIGIGTALMMVVLAAWERDANLLRPKRSQGTLRLLFLDEANRLDRENLGVLFDLCQSLDLQLLLAAPEVARAEGNTTYRLVRRVGPDGREEVIVTGRRVVAEVSS